MTILPPIVNMTPMNTVGNQGIVKQDIGIVDNWLGKSSLHGSISGHLVDECLSAIYHKMEQASNVEILIHTEQWGVTPMVARLS